MSLQHNKFHSPVLRVGTGVLVPCSFSSTSPTTSSSLGLWKKATVLSVSRVADVVTYSVEVHVNSDLNTKCILLSTQLAVADISIRSVNVGDAVLAPSGLNESSDDMYEGHIIQISSEENTPVAKVSFCDGHVAWKKVDLLRQLNTALATSPKRHRSVSPVLNVPQTVSVDKDTTLEDDNESSMNSNSNVRKSRRLAVKCQNQQDFICPALGLHDVYGYICGYSQCVIGKLSTTIKPTPRPKTLHGMVAFPQSKAKMSKLELDESKFNIISDNIHSYFFEKRYDLLRNIQRKASDSQQDMFENERLRKRRTRDRTKERSKSNKPADANVVGDVPDIVITSTPDVVSTNHHQSECVDTPVRTKSGKRYLKDVTVTKHIEVSPEIETGTKALSMPNIRGVEGHIMFPYVWKGISPSCVLIMKEEGSS